MADKIVLSLEIEGVQREIKSIKDLKQALKDSKNELLQFEVGSAGFKKAQKNVQELTGKINDLGDAAKIEGSNVERLQKSFGLLGESLAGGDLDKGKLALQGIGDAMKAIPIFLLVEGIQLLLNNLDVVISVGKQFFNVVNEQERAIRKLNQSVSDVTQALKDFDNTQKGLIKSTETYTQIAIEKAKQRGASEKEIDELIAKSNKEKLDRLTNAEKKYRQQLENFERGFYARTQGLSEEDQQKEKEKLEALMEAYFTAKEERKAFAGEVLVAEETARTKEVLATKEAQDKRTAKAREEADKRKKIAEEEADAIRKAELANYNRMADIENAKIDKEEARKKKEKADKLAEDDLFKKAMAEQNAADDARVLESIADREKRRKEETDKEKAAAKEQAAAKAEALDTGLQASKNLSDAYFQSQLNKAKGNAEAEKKIRKQMFEVEKAFSISRAVIDGIRSVNAALTIPPPAGPILAAVNAVAAAANVAKIASTKFDGGPSVSASVTAPVSAPSVNTAQTLPRPSTRLDENGRPINLNVAPVVQVVESQVTEKQRAIQKIRNQSSFG